VFLGGARPDHATQLQQQTPFTQAPVVLQASAQRSGQKVGSQGGGAIGSQAQLPPEDDDMAVDDTLDDTLDDCALDDTLDCALDDCDDGVLEETWPPIDSTPPAPPMPTNPPAPSSSSATLSVAPCAQVTTTRPTKSQTGSIADRRIPSQDT
jgi:hypothetical protein